MSQKIAIDAPCPMVLMRMKTADGKFYCKSCSQQVVDFRNEVLENNPKLDDEHVCGIFNKTQLVQGNYSFSSKWKFLLMTVISILGFNVSPINAQSTASPTPGATTKIEQPTKGPEIKKESKENKSRRRFTIRLGCTPRRGRPRKIPPTPGF